MSDTPKARPNMTVVICDNRHYNWYPNDGTLVTECPECQITKIYTASFNSNVGYENVNLFHPFCTGPRSVWPPELHKQRYGCYFEQFDRQQNGERFD